MTALRFDDLRQYSDVLRLRSGKSVTVRFVEPGDAEALQAYFRSLTTRSRYNRFLGAMSELPQKRSSIRPCRRGRPLQRDRDHDDRRPRDHRRRSPLRLRRRYRQFRVRPVDRRPLAGPGHWLGPAEESGMPRRRVRRQTPVRRYPALQRRHDRACPQIRLRLHANPDDWKLVRFEKHIDAAPQEIPCASWRLAAQDLRRARPRPTELLFPREQPPSASR